MQIQILWLFWSAMQCFWSYSAQWCKDAGFESRTICNFGTNQSQSFLVEINKTVINICPIFFFFFFFFFFFSGILSFQTVLLSGSLICHSLFQISDLACKTNRNYYFMFSKLSISYYQIKDC